MGKAAVLFSGGLDSYLSWKLFAPSADLLFVNIGQPYRSKELLAALNIAHAEGAELQAIQGAPVGESPMPSGIILHRNAHLILSAASAGYSDIMLGVLEGEINSDKSQAFFDSVQAVLNISHRGQYWNDNQGVSYHVHSPIRHLTKSELVDRYIRAGHDPDILLQTVSCYGEEDGHCGECPSCFKRWVAFANNGLREDFKRSPITWATREGIIHKAEDGTYPQRRALEIRSALGKPYVRSPSWVEG